MEFCSRGFFFSSASFLHTKNTQGVFLSLHIKYVNGLGYLSNISKPRFIALQIPVNYNTYPSQYFKISRCFIHTNQDKNNSNNSNNNKEEYIQDLFKDRIAPVIPFDRDLIRGSCLNYTDKISKAKFLKEWGSKAGIYLIEYKYYPNIYYIGRTNLFKKIIFEHSKAESSSKFHLFVRLIGIEHFNIHILEVCPVFPPTAYSYSHLSFTLRRVGVPVSNGRYNGCGGGNTISLRVIKSFHPFTASWDPCGKGNIKHTRLFSVSSNLSASSVVPPKPVMAYKNAGVDMERILLENKGKAGVYCWINLLNQKCYIGSSTNLSRRLKTYFRISFLETQIKTNRSIIYRALLKNGYSARSGLKYWNIAQQKIRLLGSSIIWIC